METVEMRPGVLGLVVLLAVGGIAILGWQAASVGNATVDAYSACCSVETWRNAPEGYRQGQSEARTQYCRAYENPRQCCLRAATEQSPYPVRLVGAKLGACGGVMPEENFPIWVR